MTKQPDIEQRIDAFIRDVTKVQPMAKSKVRAELLTIVNEAVVAELLKIDSRIWLTAEDVQNILDARIATLTTRNDK